VRIPKWLAVLFFASIALNVGVMAGYAYQTYLWTQERQHVRQYFRHWAPDAERQFGAIFVEWRAFRYRADSILNENRLRLGTLSYEAHPDSAVLESLFDQRAETERRLARSDYDFGRRLEELKPDDVRRQSERTYRRMMGMPDLDSLATPESSKTRTGHARTKKGG